jgi:hypothetical protein
MNRSEIPLSVTTILLSIVGITAAKRFGVSITRWYVTHGNHCVVLPTITCIYKPNATRVYTVRLFVSGNEVHYNVYTKGAVGAKNNCDNVFL